MARRLRGGGGLPRRRRLQANARPGIVVVSRKNTKIIPSNWDEALIKFYEQLCRHPNQHMSAFAGTPVPRTIATIAPARSEFDSRAAVPGAVTFWFDRSRPNSLELLQDVRFDRLELAIRSCDVYQWAVLTASYSRRRGQAHIHTTLEASSTSRLEPTGLVAFPGIDVSHVRYYEYRKGAAVLQGLRTVCPPTSDCGCREMFKLYTNNTSGESEIVSAAWRIPV